MRLIIHHRKFYDWEPLPSDVEVTDRDIKAGRVKPSAGGSWLYRVTRDQPTYTEVGLPESELIAIIIRDLVRDNVVHDRAEALCRYVARYTLGHHAHGSWISSFELQDDEGPQVAALEAALDEHDAVGNVEPEDREQVLAAYAVTHTSAQLVEALCKHFRVAAAEPQKG